MKQHPTATAKHFYISCIVDWKSCNNLISQSFFAANPTHEAVQNLFLSEESFLYKQRPFYVFVYTQNDLSLFKLFYFFFI
jgi:hypothetical protein